MYNFLKELSNFFKTNSTDFNPKDLYQSIMRYGTPYIEGLKKAINKAEELKDLLKPYEQQYVEVMGPRLSCRFGKEICIIKDKYGIMRISKYSLDYYTHSKDYYISLCPTLKELLDFIKIHKDSIAKREFNKSIEKERFRKIREVLSE